MTKVYAVRLCGGGLTIAELDAEQGQEGYPSVREAAVEAVRLGAAVGPSPLLGERMLFGQDGNQIFLRGIGPRPWLRSLCQVELP